jgi:hypothetical protein
MKIRSTEAMCIGAAFCAALVLAVGVLAVRGVDESGVRAALATTARLVFLLFWPAYSGSALAALFGSPFQQLKRHAREFGLAFVSALSVHLGLVGLLCLIGAAPSRETFIFFGGAAACAYLLALFSIPKLHEALGAKYWRVLNVVGMNYLAYAFIVDFVKLPLGGSVAHVAEYLPFAVLSLGGPSLRLAAFAKRAGQSRALWSGR